MFVDWLCCRPSSSLVVGLWPSKNDMDPTPSSLQGKGRNGTPEPLRAYGARHHRRPRVLVHLCHRRDPGAWLAGEIQSTSAAVSRMSPMYVVDLSSHIFYGDTLGRCLLCSFGLVCFIFQKLLETAKERVAYVAVRARLHSGAAAAQFVMGNRRLGRTRSSSSNSMLQPKQPCSRPGGVVDLENNGNPIQSHQPRDTKATTAPRKMYVYMDLQF